MSTPPLKIGLSSCMLQPDPNRDLFKGKRLLYMEESMFHWVMEEGACAYLLPPAPPQDGGFLGHLVESMDGILMTGGADVAPESYGETAQSAEWAGDPVRDAYEIALVREALARDKPLLGICRGMQLINVAFGGTLYQDLETQVEGSLRHRDWQLYDQNLHKVQIAPSSGTTECFAGERQGLVNSVHHQGVKDLAAGFSAEAWCVDDGVVEAMRLVDPPETYCYAVQWHPEFQTQGDGTTCDRSWIMREFLQEVRKRRSEKAHG